MTHDAASDLTAVSGAADSLTRSIAGLTDEAVGQPSLLPDWTRGHVLTHLARSADGMLNVVEGARTGTPTPMYASREARAADIEAGAHRSAPELRADVEDAEARLEAAFDTLADDEWQQPVQVGLSNREVPAAVLPWLRRVELEVHHVDLDLDYTPAHWSDEFVTDLLDDTAADYAARTDPPDIVLVDVDSGRRWVIGKPGQGVQVSANRAALLAWLLGRTNGDGLHTDGPLPQLESWR